MIPEFDDKGYLPPGIHKATIEEVADRFGKKSELRSVQVQSLYWLLDLAKRSGAQRLIINGSFVTDVIEPNDVDCVLLTQVGFPVDKATESELLTGLPFIAMSLVQQPEFDVLVHEIFATDRYEVPKGLIEVVL